MHTHFWDFPRQIFSLPKISPHLFGIAKPNDTLFYRKRRKNFFGCGCFILLPSKSLFTYSHWEEANSNPVSKNILLFVKTSSLIPTERSQMHTLNPPKFLSLHLFGIRKLKRTLFLRKIWKNIFSACGMTYFTWKKSFHLFGIWVPKRNLFQRKIFEKEQKICPPLLAGKGILLFYSLNIREKTFNST